MNSRILVTPFAGRVIFFALIIFLLIHFDSQPVTAQQSVSLERCLDLAFRNSPLVKMAEISVKLAREKWQEAQDQQLPAVNLNGMYTRVGEVTSFTIPMGETERTFKFGTPNRVNFDARLQLPLFTWGRISGAIQAARLGRNISDEAYRQQIVKLTDQVLRGFYSVLLNQEIIRLHRENVKRAQKLQFITEQQFKQGGVPRLEVLRTRVQTENARSILQEAQGNLRKSKFYLAKTIGWQNEEFTVSGTFEYQPVEVRQAEIMNQALTVRSDLNVLQLQQRIQEQQITIAKSGNKPSLVLFSNYNVQNGFDPVEPEQFVDNWGAGVQMSFPLFDGFSTSHKVEQASLELQKAQLREQEIRDLIKLQVQQAITSLYQAADKIASQEKNIQLANTALKVAEQQFRAGIVSSLDVLDAQQTLAQSETMYTQAIFNHIMAKIELCKIIEDFSWFQVNLQVE